MRCNNLSIFIVSFSIRAGSSNRDATADAENHYKITGSGISGSGIAIYRSSSGIVICIATPFIMMWPFFVLNFRPTRIEIFKFDMT